MAIDCISRKQFFEALYRFYLLDSKELSTLRVGVWIERDAIRNGGRIMSQTVPHTAIRDTQSTLHTVWSRVEPTDGSGDGSRRWNRCDGMKFADTAS